MAAITHRIVYSLAIAFVVAVGLQSTAFGNPCCDFPSGCASGNGVDANSCDDIGDILGENAVFTENEVCENFNCEPKAGGDEDSCDIPVGTSADCNNNGIHDLCDIIIGTSADQDGNGIPDECATDVVVPTVSQWGLIIMTLLILTAATIIIARQRTYSAHKTALKT